VSSALSAARAIVDHMNNWIYGTEPGHFVSMAVVSDGSYGITKGVVYSFPVTCRNGDYQIVQNLEIDDFSRGKMKISLDELISERDIALNILKNEKK